MSEQDNYFVDVENFSDKDALGGQLRFSTCAYTATLPSTRPLSTVMAHMIEEAQIAEEEAFSLEEILPWSIPKAPEPPKGFEKLLNPSDL